MRRSRRWLAGSGVLAGLAFLSKSPAFFLAPFIALIGLWWLASRRLRGETLTGRHMAATIGDGLLWFGCAAFVFVLLWPAMWVIPVDALRTVFFIGSKYASGGHAKGNFFLGTVSQDPGALFYPVTWLLRSSPLVWLGLAVGAWLVYRWMIGRLEAWKAGRLADRTSNHQPSSYPAIQSSSYLAGGSIGILLLFVVLFVVFMTLGEKKQDRYILPVFPILNTLAAVGLVKVLNPKPLVPRHLSLVSNLRHLLFPAILLVQGALVVANYPYYLTYYNPLLGGMRGAERMVTVGWGEGLELAAAYLNQKPEASRLRVSAWYQSTFAPYFEGEAISYSKEKGKAMAGDYVVFYINQLQRRFPDDELFRYFETRYQPEKIIPVKGADYVVIYPGPRIQHYAEDRVAEDRRVYHGIAALLGWDWPDAADPDRPVVAAGDELSFRLYWEYLGKSPEERFFFRLAGPDGRTWAEAASQPLMSETGQPATWREGQIITEEGQLQVPLGTPPGEYRLQIGFYTQAPAVTEGELVFDLPPDDSRVDVATSTQQVGLDELLLAEQQNAQLAELRLLGTSDLETSLAPGQSWNTDLYWQAGTAPRVDYGARLALVDGDGQARWMWDAGPLVSFYPTSRWEEGQVVRSQVAVTPTMRTPAGHYDLVLALLDAKGQPAGRASLGAVSVQGRPRSFSLPAIDRLVGATFGDGIELAGFNLQSPISQPLIPLHPGQELAVTLVWRALAPMDDNYTVSVQLIGPDGQVYGQRDAPPQGGEAPTSTWSPGEVLTDLFRFSAAADAPPGRYQLLVALYDPETNQRLPVAGDSGPSPARAAQPGRASPRDDNALLLGELEMGG
jgi:hypothetical protein